MQYGREQVVEGDIAGGRLACSQRLPVQRVIVASGAEGAIIYLVRSAAIREQLLRIRSRDRTLSNITRRRAHEAVSEWMCPSVPSAIIGRSQHSAWGQVQSVKHR